MMKVISKNQVKMVYNFEMHNNHQFEMCFTIDWYFFRNQMIWNHRFQQQAISFRAEQSKFGHKANDINNDPQQI